MGRRVKALKLRRQPSGWLFVTAFLIWFVHFLSIWVAGEIWPHQWMANAFAWVATAVALLAIGVHYLRLKADDVSGGLAGWSYRFARGAIVIATAAVLFSALPSFVFLR